MAYARDTYAGDGSTTNFSLTFPYILKTHVKVYLDGVLKAETTDYTWFNSTTIQFLTALANGVVVSLQRASSPASKLVDFTDASTLTEASLDRSTDQLFYLTQEAVDSTEGTITEDVDAKWDAQSKRIKNVADPTAAQEVVTKAYGDANYGGAAASAAAASASAAATSESNASTSASNASTSASNASTSASNAATSETNAATSAANAATSYDNFDDRYLGQKASDPTLDNDGNALLTGALFFLTTTNQMRVYNGSAWQPVHSAPNDVIAIAVTDEGTAIASTAVGAVSFRMPYAFTVSEVRASLAGATTTGTFTVDINEGGTTILSTKLTIDATEKTSETAATAAVISDSALADDAEITIDIDGVGDGTATGLKVYIIGQAG